MRFRGDLSVFAFAVDVAGAMAFAQRSRMSHNLHVRGLSFSSFVALYCAVMRT